MPRKLTPLAEKRQLKAMEQDLESYQKTLASLVLKRAILESQTRRLRQELQQTLGLVEELTRDLSVLKSPGMAKMRQVQGSLQQGVQSLQHLNRLKDSLENAGTTLESACKVLKEAMNGAQQT